MKLNKFSLVALSLLALSLFSNPLKAEPKWWDEWIKALEKVQQSLQPKPDKPKKGEPVKKIVLEFTPIEEAAAQAVKILNEDKFKIWNINSAGESCQADAIFIRDLKHSSRGLEREALIAILLTHTHPTKIGKLFEAKDLIENLISFGLLPSRAIKDISKTGGENLLRATRENYMHMMVSHFGYKDPGILGKNKEGSRFLVRQEYKVEFYKKVFEKFRDGPVVLALYNGFPVWERFPIFTGVKYLFVFDFDSEKGWVLRTKPRNVNAARLGLGPYLTHSTMDARSFAYTMDPNTPWLSPGFVDEGVGPEEGESFLVTHVGGLWHPGTRTPTKSFVEEIGLAQLELENFLNESIEGWNVGEKSKVVKFSILHHNFIQKFSKSFFHNFRSFTEQPPLIDLHDQGAPIPIEGENYPCFVQNTSPQMVSFGFGEVPDFTITTMIDCKAYILWLPSKKKDDSYIHDLINSEFTVVQSDRPELRELGTQKDWVILMKAIRPYVTSNMAQRAIEEFARAGITKDNFSWWQNVLGTFLVNRTAIAFPDIEIDFVNKALGLCLIEDTPYRIIRIRREDNGFTESHLKSLATHKIQLQSGNVVDAMLGVSDPTDVDQIIVKQESHDHSLFTALGVAHRDYIGATVDALFDENTDPYLVEWIGDAIKQEEEITVANNKFQTAISIIPGGITHIRVLSRLLGIRFYIYVVGPSGMFEFLDVIDTSLVEQPKVRHILCRSKEPNAEFDCFDRIGVYEDVYECACEHPPDSSYRGPRIVGNTLNSWLKLYEPGKKSMVRWTTPTLTSHEIDCLREAKKALSQDSFLDARWIATLPAKVIGLFFDQRLLGERQIFDPALHSQYKQLPRRHAGHLTTLEEDCLKEVKRAFAEGLFNVRWLGTLPPRVVTRIFELGLLDGRTVFEPQLGRQHEQHYPIYDPNNPQVGVTYDRETGEPHLVWDDTEPVENTLEGHLIYACQQQFSLIVFSLLVAHMQVLGFLQ